MAEGSAIVVIKDNAPYHRRIKERVLQKTFKKKVDIIIKKR
jgi:hypothetical protein